jgi:hypothetical protein
VKKYILFHCNSRRETRTLFEGGLVQILKTDLHRLLCPRPHKPPGTALAIKINKYTMIVGEHLELLTRWNHLCNI